MYKTLIGKIIGTTTIALGTMLSSISFAADNGYQGIEEVTVTAQKRESNLQQTPVAVSAVTGDGLKAKGITDIQDLEIAVPSLSVTQSATSSQQVFSIRGLGTSGFNAGLEPSVGVFIDGVYRSRAASAIDDFIAVERVEVLRGPQSTVFGKNTPAGVISIITQAPDSIFGYDLEQSFGNYGSKVTRGTVTGPISDNIAYRISGNYNERDGFIDNLQPGEGDVNDRDRYALRGQLLVDVNDEVSVRIIADTASITETCCGAPFLFNLPANQAALESIGATILPADIFDREIKFDGVLETDQDQKGLSVQVDWEHDGYSITSISAYRDFEEENDLDADFVDLELNGRRFESTEREVFTQEFRLQSNGGENFDWMVGYYFYDADQAFVQSTPYGSDLRAFADASTGGLVSAIETIALGLPTGTFFAENDGLVRSDFDLGTTSHSVFGKVDWYISDRLSVSAGTRWTTEDKDVNAIIDIRDPFSTLDLSSGSPLDQFIQLGSGGLASGPALSVLQFNRPAADFNDDRSENQTTGSLTVSYELNDEISLYASGNRGYKAGGFNVSADAANSSIDFEKELADSWELGAKTRFLNNQLQTNIALFSSRLRDFQTNGFNGSGFTLLNAGEIEIDGLEIESVYAPTGNLRLTLSATYLDAEYADFVGGPTTVAQKLDPAGIAFQDLSGEELAGVPDLTASASLSYFKNIGRYEGFVNLATLYRGSRNTIGSLEDIAEQGSYVTTNASIGISDPNGIWSVSLWGRNMFDEEYTDISFNSIAQTGSFNAYPNDPATFGVTLRLRN